MSNAQTNNRERITIDTHVLLSNDELKSIALENGFKLKDQGNGVMDLNPYVYDAMREVIRKTLLQLVTPCQRNFYQMKIKMIVATSKTAAIGKDNSLLWRMRSDLKRFKELTVGKVLIMGRKTYESIGGPLPNRRIFVLSRNSDSLPNQDCSVRIFNDKDRLLSYLRLETTIEEVWIAGGAEIYSLFENDSDELHWSIIDTSIEGDAYWQPNMSIWETKQISVCPKAEGDQFDHEYHILTKKENEQ